MATKRAVSRDAVPWKIYEGTRNTRTCAFKENDGVTAKDLTGYTYHCQVRDRAGGKLLVTCTITTTHASGLVSIEIPKTTDLGVRAAVYDLLQIEDADETNLLLVLRGACEIVPTVTEVS